MGKRGQPKISFFVKFIIAYKVIQLKKRWNLTPRAAWLMFSKQKGFKDLMKEHFKNRADHLLENILGGPVGVYPEVKDARINFYQNHIRKIISEFPKLKIYTPKEYKDYLAKIKARKLSGIGSLKNPFKRTRKS